MTVLVDRVHCIEGFLTRGDEQMNSNTPCSQVINSENTANDISTHIIEHQDFPNRVAIFIQDRGRVGDQIGMTRRVIGVLCGVGIMIQIQQFLD